MAACLFGDAHGNPGLWYRVHEYEGEGMEASVRAWVEQGSLLPVAG